MQYFKRLPEGPKIYFLTRRSSVRVLPRPYQPDRKNTFGPTCFGLSIPGHSFTLDRLFPSHFSLHTLYFLSWPCLQSSGSNCRNSRLRYVPRWAPANSPTTPRFACARVVAV